MNEQTLKPTVLAHVIDSEDNIVDRVRVQRVDGSKVQVVSLEMEPGKETMLGSLAGLGTIAFGTPVVVLTPDPFTKEDTFSNRGQVYSLRQVEAKPS